MRNREGKHTPRGSPLPCAGAHHFRCRGDRCFPSNLLWHQQSWLCAFRLHVLEGLHSKQSELVKHFPNASRPDLMVFAVILQGPVAIGRFLLLLATISVLTMPLTQNLWTWDHFLRGGQDFETSMLTIVIILCLAVLLSLICKRHIDFLFAARRVLAFTFHHGELPGESLVRAFFLFPAERASRVAIDRYSLPLKI
jgi:hypothetical protein